MDRDWGSGGGGEMQAKNALESAEESNLHTDTATVAGGTLQ